MPAVSKAQRRLMAVAEHHPSHVSAKNRGVLKMSTSQLHDFAATREKKLPAHVRASKPRSAHKALPAPAGGGNRYNALRRGR